MKRRQRPRANQSEGGSEELTHILEQLSKLCDFSGLLDLSELDHLLVDLGSEGVSHIENVSDTC